MKKSIFLLIFLILFSQAVNADLMGNIEDSLQEAGTINKRIRSRSFFRKVFFGGDLENGRELKQVVDELKPMVEELKKECECNVSGFENKIKNLETTAVMEKNRRGLFGWFRGFS